VNFDKKKEMEFEEAKFIDERETGGRLIINLSLPRQLQPPRSIVPQVVKKKKKKKKRKPVKRRQGLRAKIKDWLKRNNGMWLTSEIIKGLKAEGYRYPGTGKYGKIEIQLPTKCSEFIKRKDPNIGRKGKKKKYRYFYLHDESSSSDEEEERIPMRDLDDIIEEDYGIDLSAEEEDEKVLGKRKRFAEKEPKINNLIHYQQTGQFGNPLQQGGFGGIELSMQPYQHQSEVFIPDPKSLEDIYGQSYSDEPPTKRRKLINTIEDEEETLMNMRQASCNHFYQKQGCHLYCRWCGYVVRNAFK
jgi:hypothetical protein